MNSVSRVLAAAQIPDERRGSQRAARLHADARGFYEWILWSFARGERPNATALAGQAERLGLDLSMTLACLAVEDLVHVGPDGAIAVAYPFSGRPTAHRVQLNGHAVYAMCAIDALGMAPMFDVPITVESTDSISGEAVRVDLAPDGVASWTPQEVVVVSGSSCDGAAYTGCCQVLNFFAAPEHAERYLAEQPEVQGIVISLAEAVEAGRSVFGGVLTEMQ